MIDAVARPRVGVVLPGGVDAREFAMAARVATLAMLDRVPRARVAVLVASGKVPPPSGWDCGRVPRKLVASDRESFDVLVAVGVRVAAGACPVVRVPGDVVGIAGRVGSDEFWRNRSGVLRLLGWEDALPDDAGPDEILAASRSTATGTDAAAILAAFDDAARAAIACWRDRGSPGAIPDAASARRAGTQHAALRVELRMLEREVDAAEQRVAAAEDTARLITGSRTWRYTERLRGAYHQARGRLKR